MMNFFYDMCHMIPLNFVVILGFLLYIGRSGQWVIGCIVSTALIVLVGVLRHIEKKGKVLLTGAVAASLAGVFWVIGKEKRILLYEQYGFLIYLLGLAVVCIVVGRLTQRFLLAKIIVAALLIGTLAYMMIGKVNVGVLPVAGSLLVIMIYLAEIIQIYWVKSGYTEIKTHVSFVTPVLVLAAILVAVTPASESPYDWKIARNVWEKLVIEYKRVTAIFGSSGGELAYAGFSDEGSFGLGFATGDNEALVVYSDNSVQDHLYIAGTALANFADSKWTAGEETEDKYRQFDLIETRAAINKAMQGSERNYIRENTIRVESRMSRTEHVFLPLKTNLDSKKSEITDYSETEAGLLANSKIRYGDSYSLLYSRLNFDNPDLISLIDESIPLNETEWNAALRMTGTVDKDACSFANYQDYRKHVYEKYGQKSGLSPELLEVVSDITEGIEGDFEKVSALSDYFKTMNYNTSPEKIPETVTGAGEYLEYFIFESQSGYCAHYATAMVLLARELGYPARYVQGYTVAMNGNNTGISIHDSDAHAWCEVYFNNFGWIAFEATPGFSVSSGWNVENYVEIPGTKVSETDSVVDNSQETIAEDDEQTEPEKKSFPVRYIMIPILFAAFFGLVYFIVNRIVIVRNYRKMTIAEKTVFLIHQNLRVLRMLEYDIGETETISEFKHRVKSETGSDGDELAFLDLFEKILYSDYEVCSLDLNCIDSGYEKLTLRLRKHKLKYMVFMMTSVK